MNRELKFRVWSFLDKSFHYFSIGDGEEGYPSGIAGGVSEPQQYTGLKDKTGKEIYEGDLLYFVAKYIFTEPVEVIYYGSSYGCITHDERGILKEYTELNHIVQQYYPEIIGNTFQLPCKPDHNGECIHCDCWLSDCPILKNKK